MEKVFSLNFKERDGFIRFIWLVVSLIPMPFLFDLYEISQFPNKAPFLFSGPLLFVILSGFLSIKIKPLYIILVNILTIVVSVVLATKFIIPPNGSWYNPFGMNVSIILLGIVILILVLIIRFILKAILLRFKNKA